MSEERFQSFEEFWPYYVREHSQKANRLLHFLGTSAAIGTLATALVSRRGRLALLAPLCGYGAAWIGHFFIEKNKPATFKYPLWSLRADFVMFSKIIAGSMDAEVEHVMNEYEAAMDVDVDSGRRRRASEVRPSAPGSTAIN